MFLVCFGFEIVFFSADRRRTTRLRGWKVGPCFLDIEVWNASARASLSSHQSNQDKYAMFKLLFAAAAIAAISIAPAEARHNKRHQHTWSGTTGRLAFPGNYAHPGDYAHYGPDPYGVYVG